MSRRSAALYLAIDQGGQSSRALAFDRQGTLIAAGSHTCTLAHPAPHHVEQEADDLVASVRFALDQVSRALGERARHIAASGLATQRSSIACWDRYTSESLSPIISWQDTRAHAWIAQLATHGEEARRLTGLRLSAHYGASKFRWCLEQLAPVRAAFESGRLAWGPVASFLVHRLLAEHPLVVDPANASRTLLWNVATGDWESRLLALFGLPRDPLPACVPSRYAFGNLEFSGRCVPLTIVTGDQSAALFAFGRPDEGSVYINVGTGAFVQRIADRYPGDTQPFLASVVLNDADKTTYAIEGTVNGAASALRWFEREHHVPQVERRLSDWLARKSVPPLFLNGIAGLGSPYWVADFQSCFVGAGATWEKAVAVVESIVFLLQNNLEHMHAHATVPTKLRITGGLARLDGLCQRLADLSERSVCRPAECEATARGLAYLLAECPSMWPAPAPESIFEPQGNAALRARYGAWCAEMQSELVRQSC